MPQGVEDAVVIDGGRDVVGVVLEGVDGVTHCDTDASLENHRGVVATVTKGHCAAGVKALVAGHRQDALALVGTVGGDVRKLRMPTTRHTFGTIMPSIKPLLIVACVKVAIKEIAKLRRKCC